MVTSCQAEKIEVRESVKIWHMGGGEASGGWGGWMQYRSLTPVEHNTRRCCEADDQTSSRN